MEKSLINLYENEEKHTFTIWPSVKHSTLEYLPKWGLFLPASISVSWVETRKAEVQQDTAWVPTDRAGWCDLQGQRGNTFGITV